MKKRKKKPSKYKSLISTYKNVIRQVLSKFTYYIVHYTSMESLAGEHDVICIRKIIMIEAVAEVNIVFFLGISHHVHQLKRP